MRRDERKTKGEGKICGRRRTWESNRDTPEIKTQPKCLKTNEKTFSNRDSPGLFHRSRGGTIHSDRADEQNWF